jgi:predicted ester cyclase
LPSETRHGRGILSGVSTAPNKAIVMRHFAVLNGGDPADWDEIMAEDFVVHHPFASGSGRDRYRSNASAYPTVFEGFTTDVHRLVAEGDIVVAYFTTRGRHTGDLLGYAATGREFAFTGMAMYRIADGQRAVVDAQEDVGRVP